MKKKHDAEWFCDALEAGREVVIVHPDPNYDSAVFYLSADLSINYRFSRHLGIAVLPYIRAEMLKHFAAMLEEGAALYARGLR